MAWQDRDYNRDPDSSSPGGAGLFNQLRWMSVTTWVIGINVAVYLLDLLLTPNFHGRILADLGYFSADTAIYHGQVWRFITFQFIHATPMHIFFNMFTLYFFGPMVERYLGSARYLVFYLLSGMAGAVMYLLLWRAGVLVTDAGVPLVGASAGIFGVLIAAAKIAPDTRVMLLIPPIPMKLRTLAWAFVAISVLTILLAGSNAGGEAAHLGGVVMGLVLIRWPGLLGWPGDRTRPAEYRQMEVPFSRRQRRVEDEDAEVDRILDKVRREGLASLTDAEKRTLQTATERQNRNG